MDSVYNLCMLQIGAVVCRLYQLTAESLVAKWDAICMHNSLDIGTFTLEELEKVRKEIQKQVDKKRPSSLESTIYNKSTLPKLDFLPEIQNNVRLNP